MTQSLELPRNPCLQWSSKTESEKHPKGQATALPRLSGGQRPSGCEPGHGLHGLYELHEKTL